MLDVEVDQLTKRFGEFCAVDSLSFSVGHGEVFGLLGPNGAGKSTLIRMLTTLVPPTSGAARINGFDIVRQANEVRKRIGVIPQAMTTDLDLSAVENMSIFAKLYGIPGDRRRRTEIPFALGTPEIPATVQPPSGDRYQRACSRGRRRILRLHDSAPGRRALGCRAHGNGVV